MLPDIQCTTWRVNGELWLLSMNNEPRLPARRSGKPRDSKRTESRRWRDREVRWSAAARDCAAFLVSVYPRCAFNFEPARSLCARERHNYPQECGEGVGIEYFNAPNLRPALHLPFPPPLRANTPHPVTKMTVTRGKKGKEERNA